MNILEEILFNYPQENVDFGTIKKDFKNYTGKELNENKMLNLKILKEYNKNHFLTIGGALLIGKNDVEKILNVRERRARSILKDYVEKGYLKRYGKGRNTYYKL
ncbi:MULTISPECIES: hypothetical protein [unclassified Marinitoga]|uniref:hypothetical protein n=1 Tax=unclassified Marinitoga TaxID=2640159 RepID=UPI0006414F22|nr:MULTISPECIES: hypothetical protein [unclassified Marinitoga]KLO25152.1 hypothetical protein X274_00445 [Marinitoga sp. 1155]NUU98706.1 hypothetical protein [Marinitoga sp. 1154]